MVRVLMVSRGVLPIGRRSGGAEWVAFELARHLSLQKHEVTLVADMEHQMLRSAPPRLGVRSLVNGRAYAQLVVKVPFTFLRWLGQHLVGNIRVARSAVVALKEHKGAFDVVHTHGALATIILARAMRRSGLSVPLVYTEHDSTPWTCKPRGAFERLVRRLVYRSVNLRACRQASLVVANYAALAKELAERTGLAPDRFAVVPNGADVGHFLPDDEVVGTWASSKMERPYLLFVGALIERKAPDVLLHALAHAKTDLDLVVVGDGPMARELERLADRLSLSGRVLFTGAQPQDMVQRYYQEASFLVLPSVSEAVPLVLIEALSSGKPVIATRLKGIESVVRHGENGLLVPPRNPVALAQAIDLLSNDQALYARLVSNSVTSVRERFAWETVARKVYVLYAGQTGCDGAESPEGSRSSEMKNDVKLVSLPDVQFLSGTGGVASEEETAHA